jgi:hypothetical protein
MRAGLYKPGRSLMTTDRHGTLAYRCHLVPLALTPLQRPADPVGQSHGSKALRSAWALIRVSDLVAGQKIKKTDTTVSTWHRKTPCLWSGPWGRVWHLVLLKEKWCQLLTPLFSQALRRALTH